MRLIELDNHYLEHINHRRGRAASGTLCTIIKYKHTLLGDLVAAHRNLARGAILTRTARAFNIIVVSLAVSTGKAADQVL